MAKNKEPKGKKECPPGLMQAFLKVNGDEAPQLVLQPKEKDSHPANLVLLEGVVVEGRPIGEYSEEDAWNACSKVAELCRAGSEALSKTGLRNAFCEHLAYAYSILCDCARECDGDWLMAKETWETLIRSAIDRIVSAGKCLDFHLDKYRSDEES